MLRVPTYQEYKVHLKKYAQYGKSKDWVEWCAHIAELRAKRIIILLKDYKPVSAKVLDLGCGIGLTLGILGQEYQNAIGCDISDHALEGTMAMLKQVGAKNKVIKYNGKKLPFRANTFDAVLSLEVIEHAPDPILMLKEIQRVLKKNGILIITTPNKWWPIETHFKLPFLSYLPTILADLYIRLTKKGDSYENIKLPSYSQFRKMVEKKFFVEDLTLEIIKNYHKFSLDKERGFKAVLVGKMLQTQLLPRIISWPILRISVGWIFLARPKK